MSGATLADGKTFAYTLGETIGVGANGKVKLGVHKETGERVAVKVMEISPEKLAMLERESDIQHSVVHPNVVRCLGRHTVGAQMHVVMELVGGGELFQHLIKTGKQSDDDARRLFRQLISALHCCHGLNICHRDIKPENLLLDDSGDLKVADFGYAQWMHCISDSTNGWVNTSCGSPHYASPEVIGGGRYIGKQADVWSSGVVLFALLTGGLPFDHDDTRQLLGRVCRGRYNIPHWVTPSAADLIHRMLTVDPNQRITTADIQRHPWFLDGAAPAPAPAPVPAPAPAVPAEAAEAAAAAPAIRQVGRFSCQAAEEEEEVVVVATVDPAPAVAMPAPPMPTTAPPPTPAPPLTGASSEDNTAAMRCEEQERCDTPASRVVLMGHGGEPATSSSSSASSSRSAGAASSSGGGSSTTRMRSGSSCQLDALLEMAVEMQHVGGGSGGSFGSAGSIGAAY